MPDEGLTEHLNRLHAQAGHPSVRDLAKLTKGQEPGRAMGRSTIQDKLSGKNLPRMWQVLALVRACADYAASIGMTLPDIETDERVWRERTQAARAQAPVSAADTVTAPQYATAPEEATASPRPAPETVPETEAPTFSLDPLSLAPLIRAGLHDMVELLQAGEGQPTATWLPTLAGALREAGMSDQQFLIAASREKPQEVALSILRLSWSAEDQAAQELISLTASNQPPESIPIILAFLRRNGGEGAHGIEAANRLVSIISGKLPGPRKMLSSRCTEVAYALRGATMEKDVERLLKEIGQYAPPAVLLQVAASLGKTGFSDKFNVLYSVANGTRRHLAQTIKALPKARVFGLDPAETLDHIIIRIPDENRADVADYLRSQGLGEVADHVLENKPPF